MESPAALTASAAAADASAAANLCPRCGEFPGPLPPVETATLGGKSVVRCPRCGTRSAWSGATAEMIFTCESCGLPFGADRILPHAEHVCPDCRSGTFLECLPDAQLSAATETEIRAALASRWRFVSSPGLSAYLDRVARQIAPRIDGAPVDVRVVLVDDRRILTLALPSGTLLVSLGALAFLEDEAELAFALGHEIAHAASEDAAVRLTRLGFRAVARAGAPPDRESWAGAAMDLVRLGYGRKRERDADLRALEALLALRYDPAAALHYPGRLGLAVGRGDPAVAELATAHPPVADRVRRVEKALYGRVKDDLVPRVNREVFRRAAGPEILAGPMTQVAFAEVSPDGSEEPAKSGRRRVRWVVLAAVLAAALGSAGLAYFLLSR